MGTIAIQTQCCLKADDEPEDSDGSCAQENTAVRAVDAVHWGKRPADAAGRPVASLIILKVVIFGTGKMRF